MLKCDITASLTWIFETIIIIPGWIKRYFPTSVKSVICYRVKISIWILNILFPKAHCHVPHFDIIILYQLSIPPVLYQTLKRTFDSHMYTPKSIKVYVREIHEYYVPYLYPNHIRVTKTESQLTVTFEHGAKTWPKQGYF